jgi:hypothetical protein
MLSLTMLLSTAVAGEPVRCVAVLETPKAACALHHSFSVTGAGPNEVAATRAARTALEKAVSSSVTAQVTAQPLVTIDPAQCSALAKNAHVDCFPEAALAQTAYCFVSLADPACWDGEVLTVEDKGWRVFARGTAEMCQAVDKRVVAQNYNDTETRRLACAASCLRSTAVRCP